MIRLSQSEFDQLVQEALEGLPTFNQLISKVESNIQQNEIIIVLRARVADDLRTRMGRELPRGLMEQERRDAEERVRIFGAEPAEVLQDTDIQVRER